MKVCCAMLSTNMRISPKHGTNKSKSPIIFKLKIQKKKNEISVVCMPSKIKGVIDSEKELS